VASGRARWSRRRQLVYSYFVKLLRHVRLWPGLAMLPTDALREEMVRDVPWRFELDMYESGIGSLLPAGLRTPVLHHVKHADSGGSEALGGRGGKESSGSGQLLTYFPLKGSW